jgi:hypothetical protein
MTQRDDHEPAPASANGLEVSACATPSRHALRALASEPDFFRAPHTAIARLRPRIDAERTRLAQHLSLEERLCCWTRLADGAVVGLSHLARLCVDAGARSAVAPFAAIAVGNYGAGCCDRDSSPRIAIPAARGPAESGARRSHCRIHAERFGRVGPCASRRCGYGGRMCLGGTRRPRRRCAICGETIPERSIWALCAICGAAGRAATRPRAFAAAGCDRR